jgi:hypothetical protein
MQINQVTVHKLVQYYARTYALKLLILRNIHDNQVLQLH